jgi:signal transduction histidine kinase
VSGDDARAAELLDAAQAATDRGALLTRQLLAFSTGQTLIREPLDINALLQHWLPDLQRACPPTVMLDAELAPGLPRSAPMRCSCRPRWPIWSPMPPRPP